MDRHRPNTAHALSQGHFREEIANSITHGIGLVLSIAGLCLLVILASLRGSGWHVVGCSVYGATLVALYAASTLYHTIRGPHLKQIFRIADHTCIFLLIAGTYTPFTLTLLRGGWGWTLFGLIWGFALAGIVFRILFVKRFRAAPTIMYVLMGWLAIIALKPMLEVIPTGGLVWLAVGGVAYTAGIAFYARDRIPYFHAIWHVFVLAGSISHYFAVLLYVLPASA